MTISRAIFIAAVISALLFSCALSARPAPLSTAFTYQGLLKQSGVPVNGSQNFAFFLYDSVSGGSQVGNAIALNNQSVQAGIFTAVLNSSGQFGPNAFNGERRWLEIWVNGIPLSPRQELTVTPIAQFAVNAPWTGLIGVPAVALLNTPQTFTARPTLSAGVTTNSITLPASPLAGAVLTSDANGNGTWQAPSTPANALVPIAAIVAWHGDMPGAPPLPDGWLECNGQTITDPASPLHGQALPNLNGEGRFLRGNTTSGILQADDFKSHTHAPGVAGSNFLGVIPGGGTQTVPQGGGGSFPVVQTTAATGGTETRPINMSVVWIMRIK